METGENYHKWKKPRLSGPETVEPDTNDASSSTVAGVLSSFNQLSSLNKAAVARYLINGGKNTTSASEAVTPHSMPEEVPHSCLHCQKMIITHRPVGDTTNTYQWVSATMDCNKEVLLQGLADGCILFKWAFRRLGDGLQQLKVDLAKYRITVPKKRHFLDSYSAESDPDDLEYLSTENTMTLDISCGFFESTERTVSEASMSVRYTVESGLLDQLWDARPREESEKDYGEFIMSREYNTCLQMGSFRIFSPSDDPAAQYITSRPANRDVASDASFNLAQTWMALCRDTHEECLKPKGVMPSRVIDVGTKQPITYVKLHWTDEGEVGNYSALSYCWGGEQPVKSTSATAQDYTDGIRFSKLPKTLQDAMIATSKLGLRYIWIDCICIIQDDPEDVAREIAKMPQIFQEAFITISASSARSIHDGFLHYREPLPEVRLKLPYQTPDGAIGSVVLEKPRQYAPERDPISLRAWTLQEHMLSPRILDYGSQELWWICRSAKLYDNGQNPTDMKGLPFPSAGPHISLLSRPSIESWRSTLRDYTRRFLTFPGDKFPAISGIAADYGKIFNSEYVAGLWRFALPSELLWSTARSDISRPVVQRAPSWSWASVDGEISHKWCPGSLQGSITILDCNVSPVSLSAPYGSINPVISYLKVEGRMKEFEWTESKQYLREWIHDEQYQADLAHDFQGHPYVGRSQADAAENVPTGKDGRIRVWSLEVLERPIRGLILVPAGGNCFRRIGVFFRLWGSGSCGFETRVITIV